MLNELRIENFAIIDRLDLHFGPGLTTMTGETGAGKSIIIDAVETILGGRADATMVRSGVERASVEAVFHINQTSQSEILAILEREELLEDGDYITLGREIRLAGRNVARVNGRSVSVSLLRELGQFLIDVHGQSEHLSLLTVGQHLTLLDRYTFTDSAFSVEADLASYRKTYRRLMEVLDNIQRLQQSERDAARRADTLKYQFEEIQAAQLRPGEEKELREERDRLANAESLAKLVQESLVILDEGTPEASAINDMLGQVVESLASLVRQDPSQTARHKKSLSLFEDTNDLVKGLRSYLETIEFNPKRLDSVEERLSLIDSLKRKYGDSIQDVLDFALEANNELENITHAEERLEVLAAERALLQTRLGTEGEALAKKRRTAGEKLSLDMQRELADLNMSGARFTIDFQGRDDPDGVPLSDGKRAAYGPHGLERVEFLIAPNPGEGFKPLAKIASGGETSRLMLALKNVLNQADHIPTLIFDEIDQGIGGRVGTVVGEKLWTLARRHQVFCITHLPQLAAFGDHHYQVQKHIAEGRTTTRVHPLEGDERVVELAQMMGEVSEGTLHSARELEQLAEAKTTGA
jgi:DNA repair protein RecN (Recombination protein N)